MDTTPTALNVMLYVFNLFVFCLFHLEILIRKIWSIFIVGLVNILSLYNVFGTNPIKAKATQVNRCIQIIYHKHTYHSRFIPEGVAEASKIFLWDIPRFYQNYLAMSNTAEVTGGKSIAVWSQSISLNAIKPLVALRYPLEKERGAILLFRFEHHTRIYYRSQK
jgi:hypothetical protein